MHVVQVQLVERQRAVRQPRVEQVALELELVRGEVQCPIELVRIEVEAQHGIERGRRQVQATLVDRDLVAVPQIGVAPGADQAEIGSVGKQLVARGDVDDVAIEGDAAQPAVPAASLPVDRGRVPVELLADRLALEIEQVHATMAFALVAASYHRRGDKLHAIVRTGHTRARFSPLPSSPLLGERQADRAGPLQAADILPARVVPADFRRVAVVAAADVVVPRLVEKVAHHQRRLPA